LNIKKYQVLIFDCDGVIFDTNRLKTAAFKKVLSHYGDQNVEKFVQYFSSNFGKSRFVHARHFITNILQEPFRAVLYDQIINDYGLQCQALYNDAEICAGVVELLKYNESVAKYVASGSAQDELRIVFKNRGLDFHFNEIFGSPRAKDDLVKDICLLHQKHNILLIGDAKADFTAAKISGIDFLYVRRYSVDQKNMMLLSQAENFKSVFDLSEVT
jgi:HAD superfamily hydrolase (TIGR01549 family)